MIDTKGHESLLQEMETCPAERYHTLSFDDNYVGIGTNYINFKASGDGDFVLSNVEIDI